MDGGSQQSQSYSMGTPSSSGASAMGWQQPFSSANSQASPFFNMAAPQMPQASASPPPAQQSWQSMSPSYNAFTQLAAQGQPTPMANQQNASAAVAASPDIQQQPAQQPSTPMAQAQIMPQTNYTLANANQTAGLPAAGMPQPQAVTPVTPAAPKPAAPSVMSLDQFRKSNPTNGGGGAYSKYLQTMDKSAMIQTTSGPMSVSKWLATH